jgi:hypothetical protein
VPLVAGDDMAMAGNGEYMGQRSTVLHLQVAGQQYSMRKEYKQSDEG